MIATAGVLSEEESVGAPQYSLEEMKAAVDEATRWGRKVAAHAHGTEGIKQAVAAGVASIEHASMLDEDAIRAIKERGTYIVPDIYNDDFIVSSSSSSVPRSRRSRRRRRSGSGSARASAPRCRPA